MRALQAGWLRWWLPPILLLTLFVVTDLRGIDFGFHWDEREYHIDSARTMLTSGVFLARPYVYPGFSKFLVLVPSVGNGLSALRNGADIRQVVAAMASAFDAPNYLLQARSVFVIVTALSILWVYLTVRILAGRWWQATLAAAILGSSWELAYHGRWLATDSLLAQFTALCMLLLVLYQRRKLTGWLWAAAIAAGLAAGTKYQGALLVGPVMFFAAVGSPDPWWQKIVRVMAAGAISVASYLVTTPGTLIEPIVFAAALRWVASVYNGGHVGYTVSAGFPHFMVLVRYLATTLFSPYTPIALGLFLSAIVGAVFCWRADRKLAALLIGFPILYVVFFCWRYNVFIARNFLLLAPFLAVLSAWALAEALLRLRPLAARVAVALVICGALTANGAWLISAGESIRHRDDRVAAADAVRYVADHPGKKFRISPRVAALAATQGVKLPANSVESNPDEVVFFAMSEGVPVTQWIVNDPFFTRAVFGTQEVNFNYYSTWSGYDRVVVMTREKARAIGSPFAQ